MDPDATLTNIRLLIDEIPLLAAGDSNAGEIAEAFEALDDWLTAGGFLPTDWRNGGMR